MPRVRRGPSNNAFRPEQRRVLLEPVVINQTGRLVQTVRHRLEEDRRRRDALVVGLVSVGQVAPVREVEAHDTVVRVEQGGVDLFLWLVVEEEEGGERRRMRKEEVEGWVRARVEKG